MTATSFQVPQGITQTETGVELYQNSPNPFIEMTLIYFRLAQKADVVLRLFDSKGKEITHKKGGYEAGEHHLVIHRGDLREPGMYTYRLETPFGAISRKLMMY